ncbi:hypothetical protein [Rhodocaloribacter sp.]
MPSRTPLLLALVFAPCLSVAAQPLSPTLNVRAGMMRGVQNDRYVGYLELEGEVDLPHTVFSLATYGGVSRKEKGTRGLDSPDFDYRTFVLGARLGLLPRTNPFVVFVGISRHFTRHSYVSGVDVLGRPGRSGWRTQTLGEAGMRVRVRLSRVLSVQTGGTAYLGLGVPKNAPTYGARPAFTGGLSYHW